MGSYWPVVLRLKIELSIPLFLEECSAAKPWFSTKGVETPKKIFCLTQNKMTRERLNQQLDVSPFWSGLLPWDTLRGLMVSESQKKVYKCHSSCSFLPSLPSPQKRWFDMKFVWQISNLLKYPWKNRSIEVSEHLQILCHQTRLSLGSGYWIISETCEEVNRQNGLKKIIIQIQSFSPSPCTPMSFVGDMLTGKSPFFMDC